MTVHALAEPALDRGHFATAQVLLARADLGLHRLPQLGRDQAAERVAGEVAEAARAPVHVLQAAERVGGNLDAEQAAHPLAPRAGQIPDGELARDQRELELEAQDDMQRVGERVGRDADRARARRPPGAHAAPPGSTANPPALSSAASTSANAGLRATWFSHSLLWDSWIDIDVPRPRFVRSSAGSIWRSYSAWPYSCSELSSDSSSPSL